MKTIYINRTYTDNQTLGEASLYKDTEKLFSFKTLELTWLDNASRISCIPEGLYTVVVRRSKKYGRHLHVTGVDGRSLILIHWGNYAGSMNPRTGKSDILGCILVGKAHLDIDGDQIKDITSSKVTFKKIMSYVEDTDEIQIEIC